MLIASTLSRWEQQLVALASVAQSAALVRDLAHDGSAPQDQLAACINPLMQLEAPSIDAIYPELSTLSRGFQTLQDIFSNDRVHAQGEVVRYTLGMLLLRNKLMADNQMQDTLRRRLQYLDPLPGEIEQSSAEPDNGTPLFSHQERIFEQLANLYQDTISTLSYRIQVQGKIDNLKNERIANSIRALLLAGIRSAVLWYQLGGRRWRLVVYRKRIKETAGNLRRSLIAPV